MMFQVNPLLKQRIHMKNKPYFLQRIKVKKIKCRLLQFLFGALRVNFKQGIKSRTSLFK